jgi:hypothetical protein
MKTRPPSRKERGHRGVRPRHQSSAGLRANRRKVLKAARDRVDLFKSGYTEQARHPRGRQASTRSARMDGRESRSRAAS